MVLLWEGMVLTVTAGMVQERREKTKQIVKGRGLPRNGTENTSAEWGWARICPLHRLLQSHLPAPDSCPGSL